MNIEKINHKALQIPMQNYSNSDRKSVLDQIVNEILDEIRNFANGEKYNQRNHRNKIYNANEEKTGSKKFVARQPEITKEWRQKIKRLLRDYLKLKFSREEEGIKTEANLFNQEVFRFKAKTDGSWYELSGGALRYSTLSREKNHKKKITSLSGSESLIFQRGVLTRIFNGACLEYINFQQFEKKPDSFWSSWKTSMCVYSVAIYYLPLTLQNIIYSLAERFCSSIPAWNQYQHIIHPAVMEASLEILKSCQESRPKVVEICGGKGELAIKIAENHNKPMDYYLLEFNDRSLQAARWRFDNASKNGELKGRVIPIKTDITKSNDYFLDSTKQRPMQHSSIDLIIGSGALTSCVLENRKVALKVARKCHELLKPKGKMVLAGHSHSVLSREDFILLGYNVLNSFLAGASSEPFSTDINRSVCAIGGFNNQFYILEKN